MTDTREVERPCPHCDGEGEHEAQHPSWGSPFCPEAYVVVECGECDGTGLRWVEIEDED